MIPWRTRHGARCSKKVSFLHFPGVVHFPKGVESKDAHDIQVLGTHVACDAGWVLCSLFAITFPNSNTFAASEYQDQCNGAQLRSSLHNDFQGHELRHIYKT